MNARSKLFVLFTLFALTLAACAPASVQAGQGTPTSQPSAVPTDVGSGGTPDPDLKEAPMMRTAIDLTGVEKRFGAGPVDGKIQAHVIAVAS